MIPIFLRHRKPEQITPGHTRTREQSWDPNSIILNTKHVILSQAQKKHSISINHSSHHCSFSKCLSKREDIQLSQTLSLTSSCLHSVYWERRILKCVMKMHPSATIDTAAQGLSFWCTKWEWLNHRQRNRWGVKMDHVWEGHRIMAGTQCCEHSWWSFLTSWTEQQEIFCAVTNKEIQMKLQLLSTSQTIPWEKE